MPSDLASELSAYEATRPALAEAVPAATAGSVGAADGADGFLALLEQVGASDYVHSCGIVLRPTDSTLCFHQDLPTGEAHH
jgi:hypothetical protein